MPAILGQTSVTANQTSSNVVSGQLFEFLPQRAIVILLATGSATGLNCTFLLAGVAIVSDSSIGANNKQPVVPDDFVVKTRGAAGSRIFLTFRNTTGGTLTAFWSIQIMPF